MTIDEALAQLRAEADPVKAAEALAYHKAARVYLGVSVPQIDALAKGWREGITLEARVALAEALWASDIHEARVAAAKLMVQARIRPDAAVWDLIAGWVPQFDAWAIADHVCKAGEKRVMADLTRLDQVEGWTQSPLMWQRRAALVICLPLAKLPNPKPAEIAARDRVLGWAAGYVEDRDWFIQKAVAWWLRDLSKHDAEPVRKFLAEHGAAMKAFARKEAAQYLPD